MYASSEFWLLVHQMAAGLRSEGTTHESRRDAILHAYRSMAPVAQHEVLRDFYLLDAELKLFMRELQASAKPPLMNQSRPPTHRGSAA